VKHTTFEGLLGWVQSAAEAQRVVVVTLARTSPGLGGRTESIDAHGYNCLLCGWSGNCRSTPSLAVSCQRSCT